jgi:CRISPR system Cascade subunit CasD
MSTLLLRLDGPMQSWGTQSRFSVRDTGLEPSKSGVVGLLCAALGRPREEAVADLAALRMGVRVDRPGVLRREYQTAGGTHLRGDNYGIVTADGKSRRASQSSRYYLADASFLVGLEAEDEALLRRIDGALADPVWQMSLGRKAYLPGVPVRLPDAPPDGPGLVELPLRDALLRYPWPPTGVRGKDAPEYLLFVIEVDGLAGKDDAVAQVDVRQDQPISFARRQFGLRYVEDMQLSRPKE